MNDYWTEFINFCESAGWITLPLAVVSIASWYWMIILFRKLYPACKRTARIEKELSDWIYHDKQESLTEHLKDETGLVPKVLHHSFHEDDSLNQTLERYEEATTAELNLINREFGIIKTLVQAAPLLGLLGTVIGMIETFAVFGLDLGDSSDMMARGISKALLTTQIGLVVALPGLFGAQYLQSLRKKLSDEMANLEFHVKALFQSQQKGVNHE